MYEKRPTRWRDVPRRRDDVYLPILTPWRDGERKVAAVADCYAGLPAAWDGEVEDRIHDVLFDVYRNKLHHATELSAIKLTVAGGPGRGRQPHLLPVVLRPRLPGLRLRRDPRLLGGPARARGADAHGHGDAQPVPVGPRGDEARGGAAGSPTTSSWWSSCPRNREVSEFIRRAPHRPRPAPARDPRRRRARSRPPTPVPPVVVAERFAVKPRLESLADRRRASGSARTRTSSATRRTAGRP